MNINFVRHYHIPGISVLWYHLKYFIDKISICMKLPQVSHTHKKLILKCYRKYMANCFYPSNVFMTLIFKWFINVFIFDCCEPFKFKWQTSCVRVGVYPLRKNYSAGNLKRELPWHHFLKIDLKMKISVRNLLRHNFWTRAEQGSV